MDNEHHASIQRYCFSAFNRKLEVEPAVLLDLLIVHFLEGDVVLYDDIVFNHQVQVVGTIELREPPIEELLYKCAEVASENLLGDVHPKRQFVSAGVVFEFTVDGNETGVIAPDDLVFDKAFLKGVAFLVGSRLLLEDL